MRLGTATTIAAIEAQTVQQIMASSSSKGVVKRLLYVFPIASGVPYWRVVINCEISDYFLLATAVAAYNAARL